MQQQKEQGEEQQQQQGGNVTASCFMRYASLDQKGFFCALKGAGFPDMSQRPLAGFIFQGFADGNPQEEQRVTLSKFHEVIDIATKSRKLFQSHLPPPNDDNNDDPPNCITHEGFQKMGLKFVTSKDKYFFPKIRAAILGGNDPDTVQKTKQERMQFIQSMLDEEAFARYTMCGNVMVEADLLAYSFAMNILCDVYMDLTKTTTEGSKTSGLTRETYPLALKRIGLACVKRTFQGQFMDAVYEITDVDGGGTISFPEFAKAGMSLIYPVGHHSYIRTLQGFPGWNVLKEQPLQVDQIANLIKTLRTGDIILMQDDKGPMGQFINFSLNSPWSHASVVVKRSPLGGIPNTKTETLLQKYPFRRAVHRFCSPGYCRCYDISPPETDFAPSKFTGLGQIGLLESTGEGIHLYDLAHRLFESGDKQWTTIAIARLNLTSDDDDQARDNTKRINAFIESVRGGIYTVAKDELKAAISFHHGRGTTTTTGLSSSVTSTSTTSSSSSTTTQLPVDARETDDFCASLVQRFYYHMGWVDGSRPFNSVMPSDFDINTKQFACPIQLAKGYLSPLELVSCPDLNAKFPLKLPKKKK